ncbi:MAG: hypothetical protein P4L40_25380 [Terracidiphilus sp.]|nr:hypothetical protein [Terracidiphilus sp.]
MPIQPPSHYQERQSYGGALSQAQPPRQYAPPPPPPQGVCVCVCVCMCVCVCTFPL